MKKWEIGAIIGAIWGLLSLITLSGGFWLNPLIRYTFGLPTTLAFGSVYWFNAITTGFMIAVHYTTLFLLAAHIGALIGAGVGYVFKVVGK